MKKYKLIKEYPLSPQLGFIADNVYSYFCEGYPEFWEEVKEYDFEILSFLVSETDPKYFYVKRCDFWGKEYDMYGPTGATESLEECIKKYKIYSIKRKSDGEVFCIGDKLEGLGKITEIRISENLAVWIEAPWGDCKSAGCILEYAKKAKPPLFTTLDGKDIYEGDEYYYIVQYDRAIIANIIPNAWDILKHIANWDNPKIVPLGKVQFHKMENAEKYVEENKPQFSKKQVINILKGFDREVNEFEYQDGEMQYSEYIEKYKNGE